MLRSNKIGTQDQQPGTRRRSRYRTLKILGAVAGAMAFAGLLIGAGLRLKAGRPSDVRRAKGIVIEKTFASANAGSSTPVYYPDGNGGLNPLDIGSSPKDRWIVAVYATEGATGVWAIDVPSRVYYRIAAGEVVPLKITRGGLIHPESYVVEIDEAALPARPPVPATSPRVELPEFERDDLTNAKGQIRK